MSNGLSSVVQTGVNPKVRKPGLLQNVGNTDLTKLQYPGNWRDQPFVQATIPGPDQPLQPGVSVRSNILTGLVSELATSITGQPNTPQNPQLEIRAITAGDGGALGSIVRTGINFPIHVGRDLKRVAKFFATTQGILFTANQQVLSQASVRPTMYKTLLQGGPGLNDAVYLPTSTLAQVAVSGIGGHLLKQGVNPFPSSNPWDPNIKNRPTYLSSFGSSKSPIRDLYAKFAGQGTLVGSTLYDYAGGPGSVLGVGKTTISRALDRFGAPTVTLIPSESAAYDVANIVDPLIVQNPQITTEVNLTESPPEISGTTEGPIFNNGSTGYWYTGEYIKGEVNTTTYSPTANDGMEVMTFADIQNTDRTQQPPVTTGLRDFRAQLRQSAVDKNSLAIAASLPYDKFNIEARTNKLSTLGLKTSYTGYTGYGDAKLADSQKAALDQITSMEMYYNDFNKNTLVNDLIQFRIEALDNDDPSKTVFMHFRAFLNGITDNYQGEWSNHRYVGRGENMYTYKGFQRSINFSFDVPAQSKAELGPMYRKLNYLASNLAPDYSGDGYMRGPLVLLTIGGYVYSLPGFITQLTYEIPAESSWEIGITDETTAKSLGNLDNTDVSTFSDGSVKELPKMIKVTSFAFTPIHRFTPRKQKLAYNKPDGSGTGEYEKGLVIGYGQQRFLALANTLTTASNGNLYDYTQNQTIQNIIHPGSGYISGSA